MIVMINATNHKAIADVFERLQVTSIEIGDPISGVTRGNRDGDLNIIVGLTDADADAYIVDETGVTQAESGTQRWRKGPLMTVDEVVNAYNASVVHSREDKQNDSAYDNILASTEREPMDMVEELFPEDNDETNQVDNL